MRQPGPDTTRGRGRISLLRQVTGAIAVLLWLLAAGLCAQAQQDTSLSAPLLGSVSDAVYAESTLSGPSSSLIEGDSNLLSPYRRSDISDPLGFLIESSTMSPYAPEGAFLNSYVDVRPQQPLVNDATVAARFAEYRNNRALMSGAGASSLETGRAAGTGAMTSGFAGARGGMAGAAGSSRDSREAMMAAFAAGSSELTARHAGNGSLGVRSAGSDSLGQLSSAESGEPGTASDGGSIPYASGGLSGGSQTGLGSGAGFASTEGWVSVPPATAMPSGGSPGSVFPDNVASMASGTGFEDSTMGTAGLAEDRDDTGVSRLEPGLGVSEAGPFADISGGVTSFLHPSLTHLAVPPAPAATRYELERRARVRAMIDDPGHPLPSPFQQRAIERSYARRKRSSQGGRRPGQAAQSLPGFTAPSVVP